MIEVIIHGWDKYGGRLDGKILIDGEDLSERLVLAKLARIDGGNKKNLKSFCELEKIN